MRLRPALAGALLAVACAAPAAHATGLTPAQIHRAYALPKHAKTPLTIAVVVPYDTPTAEQDLATFSARFGIPSCTTANGCFRKVNQRGDAAPLPALDPTAGSWTTESVLGVQTTRGVCQNCPILLVEADSGDRGPLTEAANTAVRLGAKVVVGTFLLADPGGDRSAFNHPGVAVVTAAGDDGFLDGGFFPSTLPGVVAVGGTRLSLDGSGRYRRETVWNEGSQGRTTSACAPFTPAPSWQRKEAKAAGCGTRRAVVDIAAAASPGAQVYTSTPVDGAKGWGEIGGTSLSAPIVAGAFALAGGVGPGVAAPQRLYGNFRALARGLRDVTKGSNGTCGKRAICRARTGYDGPTGIGTPHGLKVFRRHS